MDAHRHGTSNDCSPRRNKSRTRASNTATATSAAYSLQSQWFKVLTDLPVNSAVMDYRAVNLQKKTDDNALRNYALRSDTIKPLIQDDLKQPVSPEKSGATDDNAMRNSYALRNGDDVKQPVSLEKSGATDNNAMRKTVNCAECGNPFVMRTTWHKYCSELCKIKAYEVRTGKKWRGKKTAVG